MSQAAVDATLEQRIAALVAQHRADLEPLVDQALDRALAELVAERLHTRNGNGGTAGGLLQTALREPAPATKLCVSCGEAKPVLSFEKGRGKCKRCRGAEHRARQQRREGHVRTSHVVPDAAVVDEEPPRPDIDA